MNIETTKPNPREYWSITEGVFNCLIDEERTLAFQKSIAQTVSPGDVVVDMGSGTGVLAMFAAQAGAKKVYAVEFDPNNIKFLRNVFALNGYNQIEILEGDIRDIKLPEQVDVIIGEMIATALVEEQQIQAINNMLKYAKPNTKVHLKKYSSSLDLVNNNNSYYHLRFPVVRYEYADDKKLKSTPLTESIQYSVVDFSTPIKEEDRLINFQGELIANQDGQINGLRLSSVTEFFDGSTFNFSFAYSYPIILPVEPIEVKSGDSVSVKLKYTLCGGFSQLEYNLIKK